MKTLKTLKQECCDFYATNASDYFSESFTKKMGGTQKIKFEDDFLPELSLDKREYYSGRGAKYNNSSMHEHIEVFVTKKEFDRKVNSRAKMLFESQKNKMIFEKQKNEFCKKHNLNADNYSHISVNGLYFSKLKKSEIENELNVDLTDFFSASGKTYYFAVSKIGLLLFYHNHNQSYSFESTNEEKRSEFVKDRQNWINAPFASLLGQNENENLFVC